MEAQIEIYATPNDPLRMSEIKSNGYTSLKDYVKGIQKESSPLRAAKFAHLPMVGFGIFNPKNGSIDLRKICNTLEDLPEESIEDVLIFD